jgi:hypothetical protein
MESAAAWLALILIIPSSSLQRETICHPIRNTRRMTSVQMHHNEAIFPSSKKFKPERWLDGNNKGIDKYMVSSTAGSRKCLGINPAHAELYLELSAIWRHG